MPARVLRRYHKIPSANSTWTAVTDLVPANRALVVSKIVVTSFTDVTRLFLQISTTASGASVSERFVHGLPLASGEIYTESGLVVPAGHLIAVYATVNSNPSLGNFADVTVNVFGEEVDN